MLNQYLRNYVNVNKKDYNEHLGMVEFCYNSISHSMTKMFLFELALRKEATKLMNLGIPMGRRDHSKEVVEIFKGHGENYA